MRANMCYCRDPKQNKKSLHLLALPLGDTHRASDRGAAKTEPPGMTRVSRQVNSERWGSFKLSGPRPYKAL